MLSIDSQIRELRALAVREGLQVDQVLTESMSAKAPGRPVFSQLCKRIQEGDVSALVCWKLDRLARNPVDGGTLIWALEQNQIKNIHTPGRSFSNNGDDKFWMQLEFGMAKKYVDDLSDNVKRGIRAKLERGGWPALAPIGYLNDRNNRTVIRDEDRFPIVRRMWDYLLSGNYNVAQIHRLATDFWGLRPRARRNRRGDQFAESAVHTMFANPFYYGMLEYEGELYQGAHGPMVSKSEYDRVQLLIRRPGRKRPQRHSFAYTGLIRCGACGASITADRTVNRYGYAYVYYRCTRHKPGTKCRQKAIEERQLEAQIDGFLKSMTISNEIKNWALKAVRKLHQEEMEKDKTTYRGLTRRYAASKAELSGLVTLRLREMLSDEEFMAKKRELETERAQLKEQLEDGDDRFTKVIERCEEAFEFASTASALFQSGDADQKHSVLRGVAYNLLLYDKKLLIKAHKPYMLIRDTLGKRGAQTAMLQSQMLGEDKPKQRGRNDASSVWWGLVEDVTTFFLREIEDSELR